MKLWMNSMTQLLKDTKVIYNLVSYLPLIIAEDKVFGYHKIMWCNQCNIAAKQCSSPSKLVENILATALSEVGLELLLRPVENCDENDVADSISSVAEVKEKIAGEGQSVLPMELCKERAAKSSRQENVTRHPSHSLAKNLAHGDVELASEMINKDENVHRKLSRKDFIKDCCSSFVIIFSFSVEAGGI